MAGKTYTKAPADFRALIGDVLSHYHVELCDMGLLVDALFVYAPRDADGFPSGPALKSSSGYAALAQISVTKLKDRVMGRGDCEMLVDGDRVKNFDDARLRALIDHELEHLEFTGNTDDIGRPKLKLRPHDVEFGWFDAVARRHETRSLEVMQATRFFGERSLRQLYLPGFEDGVPQVDTDAIKPSISRKAAAKAMSEVFGSDILPTSLMYVSVPHFNDGEMQLVEGWVDPFDRALLFRDGQAIETTPHLQLSARWNKTGEAA